MLSLGIQEKALDLLIIMNSAIVNLRLYPPTNAMVIQTIDRLYHSFLAFFENEKSVLWAESDRNLLLHGEPLSHKISAKPPVAIFLMLMMNWGIKSLAFEKGLEKSELILFLRMMARKPDELKPKGGIEQVIAEGTMPHIIFNQKLPIAKGGENNATERIMERLSEKLLIDDIPARTHASEIFAKNLGNLAAEQRMHILQSLSGTILNWFKCESTYSPALQTIAVQIGNLAHTLIRNRQFYDCYPIVQVFRLIISDQIQRDDEIRALASAVLKEIASDETVDILFESIRANKDNEKREATQILTMIGEFSLNRLLEILQNSNDSSERVFVLHLIVEIGPAATQIIIDRIDPNAPWFYLRNLVRLLGKTGKEEHTKVLEPLLFHEDHRVQREALKGISSIGGSSRCRILLNALSKCDDMFKASVVATLGSLKYRDAIQPLMELFKAKLSVPDEVKIDLQAKICLALGNIGDEAALPFLKEISTQMGLFGFRSYSPVVKTAAMKAIGRIMSKNEQ